MDNLMKTSAPMLLALVGILSCTAVLLTEGGETSARSRTDNGNVVWDSPSANAPGSMPVGNGDISANVWIEPSGSLIREAGLKAVSDLRRQSLAPQQTAVEDEIKDGKIAKLIVTPPSRRKDVEFCPFFSQAME